MKIFPLLLLCLFLFSCGEPSAISRQLKGSDSLVINFNQPQSDNIEKTVNTTEKKAIRELAGFVDGDISKSYKCGYDGNLMFFKEGKLLADVSFNYSDSCRHFILLLHDALTPIVMTNKAADFLKSLREERSWY